MRARADWAQAIGRHVIKAVCAYLPQARSDSLSPSPLNFKAESGPTSFSMASMGCQWTGARTAPWLQG